ncbi:glycosyltransferase [Scytonema millei]|uniref:Glycosyltransferase family 4 protein n=1 Tax=Scytonema millei VB511283 TaxID=1245923 RepID=A0A9X5E557_9CYAN|nr:glycosyltransferase [Scytonema millei]NHC34197.1 glycosyltransferase family 4 protein [Scytonema millei VB511283]
MPKLLYITTIPVTISSFFVPIARHFQAKGWQVDAMANGISTEPKCTDTFDKVWEVDLSRNPLNPTNVLSAPRQIRQILQQQQYDIVNVSTPVAAFVARHALKDFSRQGKVKLIYTAQGFHFYRGGSLIKNSIYRILEATAAPWTDRLVVVNREDEAAAKQMLAPEKVRYIPGTGLNFDRFNPERIDAADVARVRHELGLAPEHSLFLSAAEFIPRKRHRDLIQAFAKLNRPNAHLALAGDGRLFEQMQQLAKDLGIQDRVHFLGFRRDIQILTRASVATLLASEQEGLPNCVMESIALEVPVIGTDIRGTRDLLGNGKGLLCKVGDVAGLAQAMAWILDNLTEAQMMGKQGREEMKAYELQYILRQYEALYAEVLNELQPNGIFSLQG